jgi:hypothetical protein
MEHRQRQRGHQGAASTTAFGACEPTPPAAQAAACGARPAGNPGHRSTPGWSGSASNGYEPQPGLFQALETATQLSKKLGQIAQQAYEEGWCQPVVDRIAVMVRKRIMRLFEELRFVIKGPNGETLPELPPR